MTATAKSSGCGIRFFTLDKTIAVIHKASASQHIFLIVRNPQSARKLVEGGSVEIGIADLAGGILRFERAPLPTLRQRKNMTNGRIICRRFWQNFPVHCWALVLRCRWM